MRSALQGPPKTAPLDVLGRLSTVLEKRDPHVLRTEELRFLEVRV